MNEQFYKQLIYVNGIDKTGEIQSYSFNEINGHHQIVFKDSSRCYSYKYENVKTHRITKEVDCSGSKVYYKDELIDTKNIAYYENNIACYILNNNKEYCKQTDLAIIDNVLTNNTVKNRFNYFKNIAKEISLSTQDGINILKNQYEKIDFVGDNSALSKFLLKKEIDKLDNNSFIPIFPFGVNLSQYEGVLNAFSYGESVIQGPPGTGKTQTILNIIANALVSNKTIAIASCNNSAVENVLEKLEKNDLGFFVALLGKKENKDRFEAKQTGYYPNNIKWIIDKAETQKLYSDIQLTTENVLKFLRFKNRISEIKSELLTLDPEEIEFNRKFPDAKTILRNEKVVKYSSKQLSRLCVVLDERTNSLFDKIILFIKYGFYIGKLAIKDKRGLYNAICAYYYIAKRKELLEEKNRLEEALLHGQFEENLKLLTDSSMKLLKSYLAEWYLKKEKANSGKRPKFCSKDLWKENKKFLDEYPVVLSTTYSLKKSLDKNVIYDYLIIDESSQTDLATGVLALSCAKNIVIVGDEKQLPNVIQTEQKEIASNIADRYKIENEYRFECQNILSAVLGIWPSIPQTMLREHYRCNPRIINFCNQMFYNGELICMTEDKIPNPIMIYSTGKGNFSRGNSNQRQADIITNEILYKLYSEGYSDIGIITPFNEQVDLLKQIVSDSIEVSTVHKYQGREKDAIIISPVQDNITEFVDDAKLLNVAVSRAKKKLIIVINDDIDENTNYGKLVRYIKYNNFEVINSPISSIFDILYKDREAERIELLSKIKKKSDFDSENLIADLIESIIDEYKLPIDYAIHYKMLDLINNYNGLEDEEVEYAKNPATHIDFVLYDKIDKKTILAIEVDGKTFHQKKSTQYYRDKMKDNILNTKGIKLLRLATDGSNERKKLLAALGIV